MKDINTMNYQFNCIKEKIDSLTKFLYQKKDIIHEQIHDEKKWQKLRFLIRNIQKLRI